MTAKMTSAREAHKPIGIGAPPMPLPRPLERLGRWLCPTGASCWRVAHRAGLAGLALVPPELLVLPAVARARQGAVEASIGWQHLGVVAPVLASAATVLLPAATAGLTRWWGLRRTERLFAGVEVEVISGEDAEAMGLAQWGEALPARLAEQVQVHPREVGRDPR